MIHGFGTAGRRITWPFSCRSGCRRRKCFFPRLRSGNCHLSLENLATEDYIPCLVRSAYWRRYHVFPLKLSTLWMKTLRCCSPEAASIRHELSYQRYARVGSRLVSVRPFVLNLMSTPIIPFVPHFSVPTWISLSRGASSVSQTPVSRLTCIGPGQLISHFPIQGAELRVVTSVQ